VISKELSGGAAAASIFKQVPITFVTEGAIYVCDMNKQEVVVPELSSCLLVEVANRDADRKRTICGLAHLTAGQSLDLDVMLTSVKKWITAFKARGGDIKHATACLYGGSN
jgi:hypothetical protein